MVMRTHNHPEMGRRAEGGSVVLLADREMCVIDLLIGL